MAGETGQAVLRRMAGLNAEPAERRVPDTPARTLRLALARAAERIMGLKLTVTAVSDDEGPLDEIATRFTDTQLHLELSDGVQPMGYAVFDDEMRAAMVEMQMTGALSPRPADPRRVTSADAALCAPLVSALMTDLMEPDRPGNFEPWVDGLRPAGRIGGPRDITLRLHDGAYRVLEFGVDLGVGGRTGALSLVLADRQTPAPALEVRTAPQDWGRAFDAAVRSAPADLTAVLYRTRLSLRTVASFEPGTVVPLHGVTVDSLALEGPGRRVVAHGRLGQVAGLRAVRVTAGKAAHQLGGAGIAQAGGAGKGTSPPAGTAAALAGPPDPGRPQVTRDLPGPDTAQEGTEGPHGPGAFPSPDRDGLADNGDLSNEMSGELADLEADPDLSPRR